MVIDPSKVSLCERDIEDYLYRNPDVVGVNGWWIERWVKRQYAVPSGIIDLIGLTYGGDYVVVEVKNVAIDSSALAQVSRYAFDVMNIMQRAVSRDVDNVPSEFWPIHMLVIGKNIDTKTLLEAESMNIDIITFDVRLSLGIMPISWNDEFISERNSKWENLSSDGDFVRIVQSHIDSRRINGDSEKRLESENEECTDKGEV